MIVHPSSGLHYVNVFPRNAVFSEICACYKAAAAESPWMSAQFMGEYPFPIGPSFFLIFWQTLPPGLVEVGARKAVRYTESMPVDPLRADNQKEHFVHFEKVAERVDCVIAHTPTAVGILKKYAKNVILAPIGFEPSVYGVPDQGAAKTADIGFYGSMVGKRGDVMGHLRGLLGSRLLEFGSFGPTRKSDLDRCRLSLYVGHCEDPSFATTRLWQTIATSAALAIEGDRDAWPAVADRHYIRLPKADLSDMSSFMDALLETVARTDLEGVARTAYDELSKFTVRECMEKYVVPFAGVA